MPYSLQRSDSSRAIRCLLAKQVARSEDVAVIGCGNLLRRRISSATQFARPVAAAAGRRGGEHGSVAVKGKSKAARSTCCSSPS